MTICVKHEAVWKVMLENCSQAEINDRVTDQRCNFNLQQSTSRLEGNLEKIIWLVDVDQRTTICRTLKLKDNWDKVKC